MTTTVDSIATQFSKQIKSLLKNINADVSAEVTGRYVHFTIESELLDKIDDRELAVKEVIDLLNKEDSVLQADWTADTAQVEGVKPSFGITAKISRSAA